MPLQASTREVRVREKLLTLGPESLSDMELLAVFISAGHGKKSCLQLAFELTQHFGNLRNLLTTDLQAFKAVSGIGTVRYLQLQAAREMCKRSDFISLQNDIQLTHAQQTYAFLKRQLRDNKNETVVGLFLDTQHRVLAYEALFTGTINTATIHLRPIIERMLAHNAAALILAHNHPSGVSDPSAHDHAITKRLRKALDLIDARLLDHVVIGDNEVYSMMHAMKWACH